MLDDADAAGYKQPHPAADSTRKAARKAFCRTRRRGAGDDVEGTDHMNGHETGYSDNGDDAVDERRGRRGERRNVKQSENSRPKDGGFGAGNATHSIEAETGKEAAAVSSTPPGAEAGGEKRRDGSRSVLLRQVILSSNDGDNATGTDGLEGDNTAGTPYNQAALTDSEPPSQQRRGSVYANNPHPDMFDNDRLLTESSGDLPGTTSFGKAR